MDGSHRDLSRISFLESAEHRLASQEFIEALLEQSHQSRFENPRLMLHFASLARQGVESCSASSLVGKRNLARLRARALGQFSSALRVHGRLVEAEAALEEAEAHLEHRAGDCHDLPILLEWKATLRYRQRRFEESQSLAGNVSKHYESVGDWSSAARANVINAISHFEHGEARASVDLLESLLPRVDVMRDEYLCFAAYHNLAASYIQLGLPAEGIAALDAIRDLYSRTEDRALRLKALWLQGQLLLEVGHFESAEGYLAQARDGYIAEALWLEARELSSDLSTLYRRARRGAQAGQLQGITR